MNITSAFFGYFYFLKKIRLTQTKKVIFYSESKNYRNYFINLINLLNKNSEITVIYLTSDTDDMGVIDKNINPIFIGNGFIRTLLFSLLKCDMLIMTLTDLGNHQIIKSKNCKNYLYIFHSLVSTHKTYTHEAFKNYDTILTNGNYQKKELEYYEKIYNHPKKKIYNTGYMYLEKLENKKNNKNYSDKKVLFAPSWNKSKKNLFNDYADKILDHLIKNKYSVTLRTHPELLKRSNSQINNNKKKYLNCKEFEINLDITNLDVLNDSSILITDNGGIAMEYILVQKKPVLFLNYMEKIHNKFFNENKFLAIEDSFKKFFGYEMKVEDIENIDSNIKKATLEFSTKVNEINNFAAKNEIILNNQTLNASKIIRNITETS